MNSKPSISKPQTLNPKSFEGLAARIDLGTDRASLRILKKTQANTDAHTDQNAKANGNGNGNGYSYGYGNTLSQDLQMRGLGSPNFTNQATVPSTPSFLTQVTPP